MGNTFLQGHYAPVSAEVTRHDLDVTGTIPDHLDGRYLRNGPNPIGELDPDTYNWFMGDGMVHGVRLRDGRAEWYRNRWVRGPRAAALLGEPPPRARRRSGMEIIGANTNIIGHAGKLVALVEAGNANYELTGDLGTAGPCDFDGTVRGGFTAHPKHDPATGELHAVSYHFGMGGRVRYDVIGADGRAVRSEDIDVGGSPMMHDFSLTANHVVLYDLPVTFDAAQAAELAVPWPLRTPVRLLLSALIGRVRVPDPLTAWLRRGVRAAGPYPYCWNPHRPARVGVLRRNGTGGVRWFDIPPCYVFHTANAYDDGDTIVLDLVRHPKVFYADRTGPAEGDPTLERWRIDLRTEVVTQDRLCDRPQEFPRIDERRTGLRHRFGYVVQPDEGALLKHDLHLAGTRVRRFGAGRVPGEFVFEPRHPGAAEDDGVLMGFVYDAATDRSDLMLLDAETLDTVAAVHLPQRVPAGFHGNWIPTEPEL
ncbi:carotenoid oxygenase family protein [Saccharomonospora piscinae]|uniref:carotenoid oxygenase family protein n=1 Tax=Saccharomonospora piscinae TaxID=687388 RepID=UPI000466481C|nr:carotenoid oxygenase family protein [Saccharomonospora piscinae]